MSTVAFDCVTTDPCTITNCNVVYGTEWWNTRLNQWEQKASDGTDIVTDSGPTKIKGVLMLKNVSKALGDALRTWIVTKAIFAKNPIRISPPVGVDIGAGDAGILTCRYDGGPTVDKVLTLVAPGNYNVKFPYRT
jgi:hypothetical protein